MADRDPQFEQKVLAWIEGQGQKQPERAGSPWGWVMGAIVGAVALLGVAWFAFKAWRQGKELAKLKHEKDVSEEKVVRAEVEAKIADNEEDFRAARVEATTAHRAVEAAQAKIEAVEVQHKSTQEAVDALRNWDDVDRYLGRPPGDSSGSAETPP